MKSVPFFALLAAVHCRPEEEFANVADSTVHSAYGIHSPYAHVPIYYVSTTYINLQAQIQAVLTFPK